MNTDQRGAVLMMTFAVLVGGVAVVALFALGGSAGEPATPEVGPVTEPPIAPKDPNETVDPDDPKRWHEGALSIRFSKSEGILKIYRDGALVKEIPAISGKNKADKTVEGDRSTPEGTFYICVKNPQSQYLRSLGLSYPNLEDAKRGKEKGLIDEDAYNEIRWAIGAKRTPPWKTPLGGEIFIHGAQGNRTSTLGCISLTDKAILEIYPHIRTGTMVTITP